VLREKSLFIHGYLFINGVKTKSLCIEAILAKN
jgi:hypothetical protein